MRYDDRRWKNLPRRGVWPAWLTLAAFALGIALGACCDLAAPVAATPRVFDDQGRPLVPVTCRFFAQGDGTYQHPIEGADVVWIVAQRWR